MTVATDNKWWVRYWPTEKAYEALADTSPACVCSHLQTSHTISETTRRRTFCNVWTAVDGKCECRAYEAAP